MVQDGTSWCKMVQDGARWWKMVHAPCNTMQYHLIPCNTPQTMPYHAHQALSCNTIQYRAIPRHTVQCSAIQCNALLYHTIPISSTTADGDDLMEIKADNVYLVDNDGNNHLILNDWRVMIILMLISWYGQWSSSESMWLVKRWW